MRDSQVKQAATKKAIRMRPFSRELNFFDISSKIWGIQSECTDIQWADDQLDDILGDELADTFRVQYSDLAGCCERITNDLTEYRNAWDFVGDDRGDAYWDALVSASGGTDDLMVYDEAGEEDYTPINGYMAKYAERMAGSRVKNLTKDKLIELMGDVIWLLKNYWDVMLRFYLLKGIFDLVQEEACQELNTVKGIETAWAAWDEARTYDNESALDLLTAQLPIDVWLY